MTRKRMLRRIRSKDAGFTLVELMVVVMIIAILMAIAIPTFLNSRKRAQDSAAKSNVRNGLAAAMAVFSEDQVYPATTALMLTKLAAEEPSLTFVATASTGPKMISVFTDAATATAVVSVQAKSNRCFSFKNVSAAGGGGGTTEYDVGHRRVPRRGDPARHRRDSVAVMPSPDRVVGLDVGTRAVRLAEVELGPSPVLRTFGQVDLPPGAVRAGEVVDVDAVAEAIGRLRRETGLRQRTVRVGVASERVVVRTIELAAVPDDELADALRFQAQDYITIPIDDAVLDFHVLERGSSGPTGNRSSASSWPPPPGRRWTPSSPR